MPRMLCVVALCLAGCDLFSASPQSAIPSPGASNGKVTGLRSAPPAANPGVRGDREQRLVEPTSEASAPVGSGLHTPEKSSAERKAIVDAVRPWAEKELGQEVIFKIDHLAVEGGFAFLFGRPLQPDGERIDYRRTRFREDLEQGFFEDQLSALVRYGDGGWTLVTSALGSTDVPWVSWASDHSAPPGIFPGPVE